MNFDKKMELMRQGSRPIGENSVSYVLYTNADMEQNDPNHPDYVKNRPFYKEAGTTVTWDGEPTGVSVELEGVVLHKVSDYVPQTLVDCEVIASITRNGETEEMSFIVTAADAEVVGVMEGKPVIMAGDGMIMVFPAAGTIEGAGFEIPEAGIYFGQAEHDSQTITVTKLVCGVYTKKLDPAFLPFRFFDANTTDITSIDFSDWKTGEMAFLLGEEVPL